LKSSDSEPTESADSHTRLFTKQELAKFLGVSSRTVEVYQRYGLPFYRVSARRNRYDLSAVKRWLEERRGSLHSLDLRPSPGNLVSNPDAFVSKTAVETNRKRTRSLHDFAVSVETRRRRGLSFPVSSLYRADEEMKVHGRAYSLPLFTSSPGCAPGRVLLASRNSGSDLRCSRRGVTRHTACRS
jgi:hypothetical protein